MITEIEAGPVYDLPEDEYHSSWLARRGMTTTITEPCWIADMPEGEYHTDPCPERSLSSTMARTLLMPGGPARLHAGLTFSPQTKRAFDVGHAAHEKILGRGQGAVSIPGEHLTPSGNVSSKKATVEWLDKQRDLGLTPLTAGDVAQVDAMAEALLAHPLAADLLTQGAGKPELSMFTVDPGTGRWLRGRIDFLASRDTVVDYKTSARTVDAESWSRVVWTLGYHVQAAHYLRQAVLLDLAEPNAEFLTIAQEKTPPYMVSVSRLDDELLAAGHAAAVRAAEIWDRCLTLNDWPGLPHTIQTISAPRWARTEDITEGDY